MPIPHFDYVNLISKFFQCEIYFFGVRRIREDIFVVSEV